MIKKLIYSYTLYQNNSKSQKTEYKVYSNKKYCYGDDEHSIDGVDYYAEYCKPDNSFFGYVFNSKDLDKCIEFAYDEYIIRSTKKLTNEQILESFKVFMAGKALHLHEIYLYIKDALDKEELE